MGIDGPSLRSNRVCPPRWPIPCTRTRKAQYGSLHRLEHRRSAAGLPAPSVRGRIRPPVHRSADQVARGRMRHTEIGAPGAVAVLVGQRGERLACVGIAVRSRAGSIAARLPHGAAGHTALIGRDRAAHLRRLAVSARQRVAAAVRDRSALCSRTHSAVPGATCAIC